MVGLSVILESCRDRSPPQVIRKGSAMKAPPLSNFPAATTSYCGFLERCFLCRKKLLPGKDIYMYNGDKGFCSEECRCRQIFMDEDEKGTDRAGGEYNCSVAATAAAASSPASSTPPSAGDAGGKAARNRRAKAFAAY